MEKRGKSIPGRRNSMYRRGKRIGNLGLIMGLCREMSVSGVL